MIGNERMFFKAPSEELTACVHVSVMMKWFGSDPPSLNEAILEEREV